MAIKGSGPLSFTDITAEFSDTPPNSLSEFYRGGGKVPSVNTNIPASGAISFSNFYGATNSFSFTVTTSQQEQSISSLAQAAGWDGSSALIMTVNSGVYLWSDNILNPGLLIDVAGSTVINNGYIIGRGGDGGHKERRYITHDGNYGSGQNGGQAINVSAGGTTIINNAGAYIAGGGGGGYGWHEAGGGGAGGGLGTTPGGAIGQSSAAPTRYGYIAGGVLPSWSVGSEGSACGGSGAASAGYIYGGKWRKIIGSGSSGGGRILTGTGGAGAYFQVPTPTTIVYFSSTDTSSGQFPNIFPAYARYYGGTGGNQPPTPPKATGTNERPELGYPGGGGWGAAGGAYWRSDGTLRNPGELYSSGSGGAAIAGTSRTVTNNGTIWGSTA